jgi:endonuclease YncB( thermonuclease family)
MNIQDGGCSSTKIDRIKFKPPILPPGFKHFFVQGKKNPPAHGLVRIWDGDKITIMASAMTKRYVNVEAFDHGRIIALNLLGEN